MSLMCIDIIQMDDMLSGVILFYIAFFISTSVF